MSEHPRFLDLRGERLFAVIHRPAADSGRGVVFCHPLGEEKLWAHRVFVTFARELEARGFTVVRFDFRGEGDSDRSFEQSSLSTRIEDTNAAIQALRDEAPGLREISLLGLRFGSIVAAATAADRGDVNRVIHWDPVTDGSAYMQSVLRINLAYQMALHRKVVSGREELVARMERGETVNIEGYELCRDLFREVSGFRLVQAVLQSCARHLLVQIGPDGMPPRKDLSALTDAGSGVTTISVVEEPFWKEIKTFYQRAENLFRVTCDWLEMPA